MTIRFLSDFSKQLVDFAKKKKKSHMQEGQQAEH